MEGNRQDYNEEVITKFIDDCAKSDLGDLDSKLFSNLFIKDFTFIKADNEQIQKLKSINDDFDIRNFKDDYYLVSFIGKELGTSEVRRYFDEISREEVGNSENDISPSKMDKEMISSSIKEEQLKSLYFSKKGKYNENEIIDNLNKLMYNVEYDSRYIRNIKKKIVESPYKAIVKILAENYC